MTFDNQERIDAGLSFDRSSLPTHRTSLAELATDATELRFNREGASHRGIRRFASLRRVWLYSVNQALLEELAEIPSIEQLVIDGLTATDLTPLHRLKRLRRLILIGGTKIQTLDWVTAMPRLEVLGLENFKRVWHLDPLASLTSLSTLGVEGSIWTRMRVASLEPLSSLRCLRSLFLTNLISSDRSLRPLHSLTHLTVLQIGALFPDEELLGLREALPNLRCAWFGALDRYGSTRKAIKAAVHEAQ